MKKITPFFLIFVFLGTQLLEAQINNEGILKIETGTLVYFGDNYTNEATAVHYSNGDLHINGDFINDGDTADGTFTPTAGTTYFDNISSTYLPANPYYGINTIQTLSGTTNRAVFYNLEVANHVASEGLAVVDDFELRVLNDVDLTAGDLRLMSDSQLIQTRLGVSTNSGTGHLLKDQDGAENSYRYNYWSSPVQNDAGGTYTVNGTNTVLKDGITADSWNPTNMAFTGAGSSVNYNGSQAPATLNTRWIWKYVDSDPDPFNDVDWVSLFDLGTTTASAGAAVNPAEGFIFKGNNPSASLTDTYNYTFEGKPNDGNYSVTLTANKEYLVGNPYPSAFDADDFISDNSATIDGTIYFWEDWTTGTHVYRDYSAGYSSYTPGSGGSAATLHPDFTGGAGTGAIIPQRYLPVGQGFIIRSESSPGGVVNFNNSHREFVIEGATSVFTRTTNNSVNLSDGIHSRIRFGYEQPSGRHRNLVLAFTDGGSDVHDYGYEAVMLDKGANDMYFKMDDGGNNFPYIIQGVGPFNIDAEYPFSVIVQETGIHSIMVDGFEDFTGDVYVFDAMTGLTTRINNIAFTFDLPAGEYNDRFSIVFKPANVLDVDTVVNDNVNVYFSGTNDEIVIDKLGSIEVKEVKIFNAIGQLITKVKKENELNIETIRIPFKVAQGMYIVQVNSNLGKGGFKIINH